MTKLIELSSNILGGLRVKEISMTRYMFNKDYEELEKFFLNKYNAYSVSFIKRSGKYIAKLILK